MAVKVLGQAVGNGSTLVALYTVPTGKTAVVSTLMLANTSTSTSRTAQVLVQVAGAAEAAKQVLIPTRRLSPGEPFPITLGIALGPGDVLSFRGSTSDVVAQAFGSEN